MKLCPLPKQWEWTVTHLIFCKLIKAGQGTTNSLLKSLCDLIESIVKVGVDLGIGYIRRLIVDNVVDPVTGDQLVVFTPMTIHQFCTLLQAGMNFSRTMEVMSGVLVFLVCNLNSIVEFPIIQRKISPWSIWISSTKIIRLELRTFASQGLALCLFFCCPNQPCSSFWYAFGSLRLTPWLFALFGPFLFPGWLVSRSQLLKGDA